MHGRDDGQTADELRNESEIEQVLRHDLREELRRFDRALGAHLGAEPDGALADPFADGLVHHGARTAADEADVRRIDREALLVRVHASALRRYGAAAPARDLPPRLLH